MKSDPRSVDNRNVMPKLIAILAAALCLSIVAPAAASAASLEPAVDLSGAEVEVSPGHNMAAQPIYVISAPSKPNRLFVVERPGQVLEVNEGSVSVYASFPSLVACCNSERGLLSIALAPGFESSGRIYAAYTGTTAAGGALGDLHVDSFVPDGAAGSGGYEREPIISWPHSVNENHNGGQLQFGPEGRTPKSCLARSSASTPNRAPSRRTPVLRAIRSPPARVATRSGPTACATPGASPSTASPATW
jgi:glucose/arabinose dehydrogenase